MTLYKKLESHGWILRIVALLITLVVWLIVLGGRRVEMSKKIFLDFEVPAGLMILNDPPREITYRLAGPIAFLKEIESRSIIVPVDLSTARAGEYEVVIREDMIDIPAGLKVISVSQGTVLVKLAEKDTSTSIRRLQKIDAGTRAKRR